MNKTGLDLIVKTKDARIFTFKDYGYIVTRDFAYKLPYEQFYINCAEAQNNVIPALCDIDEFDVGNIIKKYEYVYDGNTPLLYVGLYDAYYYLDINKFRKYFGDEYQYTLIDCGTYVKVLYYKTENPSSDSCLDQNISIGIMMLRRYKEKLS